MAIIQDIIIVWQSKNRFQNVDTKSSKEFELVSTDDWHFFLGMKIQRIIKNHTLLIAKYSFIEKILKRFKLAENLKISNEYYDGHRTSE